MWKRTLNKKEKKNVKKDIKKEKVNTRDHEVLKRENDKEL